MLIICFNLPSWNIHFHKSLSTVPSANTLSYRLTLLAIINHLWYSKLRSACKTLCACKEHLLLIVEISLYPGVSPASPVKLASCTASHNTLNRQNTRKHSKRNSTLIMAIASGKVWSSLKCDRRHRDKDESFHFIIYSANRRTRSAFLRLAR